MATAGAAVADAFRKGAEERDGVGDAREERVEAETSDKRKPYFEPGVALTDGTVGRYGLAGRFVRKAEISCERVPRCRRCSCQGFV